MIRTNHNSPIGPLTLASNGAALTALVFADHWKTIPAVAEAVAGEDSITREAGKQLDAFFAGKRTAFDLPLAPHGTDFYRRIWTVLEKLPYGSTTTYAALAAQAGVPKAARAIGGAVGRNPLSIIVPCHRVLGANGAITGYAGGLERKRFLLDLEARGSEPVKRSA